MHANYSEYIGMMQYLSESGASLLDVVLAPNNIYETIKQKMFGKSQVHNFEPVLDKSRRLIESNKPGTNVVRYLLHTLNNKVIKNQVSVTNCWKLSDLYLKWGCIPLVMPFATSANTTQSGKFGTI